MKSTVSAGDAMVCIKECFLKIPKAPNVTQLDLVSPRCHSIAQVGRLLRPADFGNVIVLCECIQVSVKVLGKPKRKPTSAQHHATICSTTRPHYSTPCLPSVSPLLSEPRYQALQQSERCHLSSITTKRLGKPPPG